MLILAPTRELAAQVEESVRDYGKHVHATCAVIFGGVSIRPQFVRKSKTVGQLRLMYVEPKARGLGIGSRLADECVRFARQVGYRKVVLWTNSVLVATRHIYEKAGFRLVHSEPHRSFGRDLMGETWELTL